MTYSLYGAQQPGQNSQYWTSLNPWTSNGLGQAAFGAPMGAYGAQQFGMPNINAAGWGGFGGQQWGQRQLSQQDVGDVVRQLLPLLPNLIAQAQPQAAFAYNPYGQNQFDQTRRMLTPQDVNEVVRQILPLLPQIVSTVQGQSQFPINPLNSGFGQQAGIGQAAFAPTFGAQAADGLWANSYMSGGAQQRHLSQQDVGEVVRHLTSIIPQVIGNLQASQQNQPRMN